MAHVGFRTTPGRVATLTQGRKVVQTWSFRGSKSRNKVSVGEPAEGSLKNRPVFRNGFYSQTVYTYLGCFGRPPFRRRLRLTAPARGPKLVCLVMSEYYIIVKTFNNGSLGSGIDEERSEMR